MREQWVDGAKKRHRASSFRNLNLYLQSARPDLLGCDLGENGDPQPLLPSGPGLSFSPSPAGSCLPLPAPLLAQPVWAVPREP